MDENTLNDLLECSVCLERLDTSSKVLPCQHTFCRKCLEVIYSSRLELRCPECRILVETKIDDLPPNVLLMRILEGMKNAASKQQSIINDKTIENINKIETSTGGSSATLASNVGNEERLRQQQFHEQRLEQRQIDILHFHQQLQQQYTVNKPQQQQRHCIVPHAYALYDFESNELNDLNFKKGDLILLKRKIDSNWYVGQLKGVEGNFPINYVQVVEPLPTAMCLALYDFKMGPNEEEGCLTFKKGTLIQVLRRVDHNWAEGRIGSSIGIFPIAFVELNQMAKDLLDGFSMSSSTRQKPTPYDLPSTSSEARNLPPLPPVIEPILSTNNSDSTISSPSANTASSSPNYSTTTSPASVNPPTSSSNSGTFHSMPNSPQSSKPTTPQHSSTATTNPSNSVRLRNNDLKHKRHSLNALLNTGNSALSLMQTNRHSAEILSISNDSETETNSLTTVAATASGQTTAATEQQVHTANIHSVSNQPIAQNTLQNTTVSRHNVLKSCVQQNIPPSLPWGYLALYPYKPRKNDELELKKSCVYMVTERCLDGWFKGKNWNDVCGVFPGNYVTPLRARDQQQLMHSWKLIPPTVTMQSTTNLNQISQPNQQLSLNYPLSMRNDLENIHARLTLANITPHLAMPPDLPPRYLAISPPTINNSTTTSMTAKENRDREAQKEKPTTTGCISTSSSGSTASAPVGLKKFLNHIKYGSKSHSAAVAGASAVAAAATVATIQSNVITLPNSNISQQQQQQSQKHNSQIMQSQTLNASSLTPVHVRSGSCPSQLLENLLADMQQHGTTIENKTSSSTTISQQSSAQNNFASNRIKDSKERPSLENSRPTIDSTLRSIHANHVQQQSALMSNKCQQQQYNTNFSNLTAAVHHRKSHSLDASNILQSSPTNTKPMTVTANSLTNNSNLGAAGCNNSMIANPQCKINAAAIHASATTKSTQNTSDSRFRCVVPYPPNSDIELDLQVGDIIFVYRKPKNGWYKGTNLRTYKTGLFPASFVEPDL